MKTVYEKSQAEEEGRLRFMKEISLSIHDQLNLLKSADYKSVYEKHKQDLESMSPVKDIKWWHNARGMGIHHSWPVFEEADKIGLSNSVSEYQSKRANKHIAGGSEIETVAYKSTGDSLNNNTNNPNSSNMTESKSATTLNATNVKIDHSQGDNWKNEFSESVDDLDKSRTTESERHETIDPISYNGWDKKPEAAGIEVVVLYNYEACEDDELLEFLGKTFEQLWALF